MSIWANNPDLFLYTKGINDVYLWRCNKTTWMPMIAEDFDVVARITDHQSLIGDDSLFDWQKNYFDDLVAYISPRRLLVNSQGLVIAELHKFGQNGKMDENELPFYIRSLDVLSLKPFNLRDRAIPSRTVRYLGGEGRAVPAVEDSVAPGTTTSPNDDDDDDDDEKRAALEKQVAELIAANKTLKSEKEAAEKQVTDLNDKNKALAEDVAAQKTATANAQQERDEGKRDKEAAEKQVTDLNDKNKALTEDVAAQKTATANAQQERDEAKKDKEAAERKAVDLQAQIDNKKEVWMNDLSENVRWLRAESLQPVIHRAVSGTGYTTFRVVVVVGGERGTFTVDDNTTNVRASYIYRVKLIDYDDMYNVDINLQRATKEYKAVKLEDLNPSREKARFGSNWFRGMYNGDTYVIKEM